MENFSATTDPALQNVPAEYVIRVRGWLDPSWFEFYDDLEISVTARKDQTPETRLSGQLADQSELLGVLMALDHFGLVLLSVELMETPQESSTLEGESFQ